MHRHSTSPSRFRWASPVLIVSSFVAVAVVSAGDLNPPPGAIQSTNRTTLNNQVITLPFTISQCGSYVLTSPLTGTAGQNGIIIDADNVTLDLNGFCLTGGPGTLDAIFVNGPRRRTTIRNGSITGWDGSGINASGAGNSRFEDLSIGANNGDGVRVGSDGVVRGLSVSASGVAGIRVSGDRNRIEANHVSGNGTGILVAGTDNLIVKNSAANNTTDYSIVAGNAYGPIVGVAGAGDISTIAQASHPWANFSMTCVQQLWCRDADNDTFGDPANTTSSCTQPLSFVADCTDCDDNNPLTNPIATEICDGADNDCDGNIDNGAGQLWCEDFDNDTYGNGQSNVFTCTQPPGFVSDCTDCLDTDPLVNPGATEVCSNGVDDNCDGTIDEGCGGCILNSECGVGEFCCAGTCVNVQGDTNNCGGCGNTCPTGWTCQSGSCTALSQGDPCTSGPQCASNFCIDGVCCNNPCNGTCEMCNRSGSMGLCSPVPVGQDPSNECPGPQICGAAQQCCLPTSESCSSNAECCSGTCLFGSCQ